MKQNVLQKPIRSFTKKKFWTTTMAMLLFFMMLCTAKVHAQIPITVGTPLGNTTPPLAASYTSLGNFLTALNAVTAMTGDVYVSAGTGTETAPPKGFTIGSATLNAANSAGRYITISGDTATSIINAGLGTSSSAVSPDGIVKLVGANYIIFQGFILNDNNTNVTNMMEYGIGLFKAGPTDGCTGNEISFNTINMKRANVFTAGGPMIGGSTGIIMVNSLFGTATSPLTPTDIAGSSSGNNIIGNTITGGMHGINLSGYADATAPYTFADKGNSIGLQNNPNIIENFGTDGAASPISYGIYASNQFDVKIDYNNINNNNGVGVNHLYNLNGIQVNGFISTNPTITNNIIKLQSGSNNFQLQGIVNACGTNSIVNINSNTIKFGYPNGLTPAAVAIRGINNASVPTTLNINNNTIEGIAGVPIAGTGETNFIINNTTTVTANVTTNGNIIRNFERTGASGSMYGIRIFATNWTANGNSIDNLKWSNSTAIGETIAIQNFGASTTNVYSNNIISNLTTATTGAIVGIRDVFAGAKTANSNTISNFGKVTGTADGGTHVGILLSGTTNSIFGNKIFGFAGNYNNVCGILATSSGGGNTGIRENKIYDLSSTAVNAVEIFGIRQNGDAPAAIWNNVISGITAPNVNSTAFTVNGISISDATPANLFYNTVLISGTSSGANFSSSAITSGSLANLVLRNNIFINNAVPKGTGRAAAYFRNGTVLTSYDTTSNNNLLAGSSLYFDTSTNIIDLPTYKSWMTTRDQASVTETSTPFTSLVGSNVGFLQLANNVISVANNNAAPVTSPLSVTVDYFGVPRSGTTPDIGASEFNGLVCVAPAVYAVNGGGNSCVGSPLSIGLTGSQLNVNYQIFRNGILINTIAGTGGVLPLGSFGAAATYSVNAFSAVVGCPTPVSMTGNAVITLDPTSVGGSVVGAKTICSGTNSGTLTLSGNTGTVLRWEQSVSPFITWTTIANTTSTFTSGALLQTTGFRAVSKSGSCAEAFSSVAAITVKTISATSTRSQVTCNGGSNGAADLFNVSGGTAPYSYLWNNGAITASITGLSAGTYSCTVGDSAGCSRVFGGLVIFQPTAISLAVGSQNNIACFGGTGFASVTPSGGTAPYTYLWTGGGTASSKSGLAVGSHSVTVTDANGCQATRIFNITQPTAVLSGSTSQTNVACFGGATGAINLTPAGGTPPYTFNWGGGITTEDRTGLVAGTYAVTITDANGCTAIISGIAIAQPTTALAATVATKTNVLCFGGNNGSATISVSGGTAGYSYNWSPGNPQGDGTATVTGLTASATWSCAVTDANGCTTNISVPITQPFGIDAIASTQTNVSCNGGNNGRALVSVANGTPPYTYDWTPGNPTGDGTVDATALTAGNWNCLVTDANGCTRNVGFTITEPASAVSSSITSIINASCGTNNGAATASAAGGTPPYNYDWAPGIPTGDGTANVSGLSIGNYSCTITDSKGCTSVQNFSIGALSTTWNNGTWNNGIPDSSKITIFESNYVSAINIIACSVVVSGTANVVFPSAANMTITNGLTVAPTASLTFESNSNLIQINAATNTGNIVYKRNADMNRLDYVFWSSPVTNQNLLAFTPNTLPNRFYTFSEPTKSWMQVASPATTNFEVAKGYSLRAPNNFVQAPAPAQTFVGIYTGVPNNGNITVPVTTTASPTGAVGFNLIGNPYPSTINATRFLQDNTGAAYFWTHQSYFVGTTLVNGGVANYATFSLAGAVASSVSGTTNVTPNGFIQAGQGFMFLTTTNKNVTFTNAMRDANNEGQFFRTAQTAESDKLWLNLTNNAGAFSQTMVAYLPNTTTIFDDGYDAVQINTSGNILSSNIENQNYSIQSRGNFVNTDVVKLNLSIATAGNYTLSKDNTNGIFTSTQDFFLKDNLVGTTHNIKQSPYNFVATTGSTANRFEIVYQNAALSNANNIFENGNVIVFEQNGNLNISATTELKNVKIFDIQGRNIFEAKDINAKATILNGFRPQQQVLLIQITNNQNQIVTKKVVF